MLRQAAVEDDLFVKVMILKFKDHFANGILAAYSDQFCVDASVEFENKISAQSVYVHLKANRGGVRTIIFQKLGIEDQKNVNVDKDDFELSQDNNQLETEYSHGERIQKNMTDNSNVEEFEFSTSFANDEDTFDLCISNAVCTYDEKPSLS